MGLVVSVVAARPRARTKDQQWNQQQVLKARVGLEARAGAGLETRLEWWQGRVGNKTKEWVAPIRQGRGPSHEVTLDSVAVSPVRHIYLFGESSDQLLAWGLAGAQHSNDSLPHI